MENLVDGRRYRVESRNGMHRPFIGRLRLGSQPFGFPPEFYREFDNVILHPFEPRRVYGWGPQPTDREYAEITRSRFFESGESMMAEQVVRELTRKVVKTSINKGKLVKHRVPENAAGVVERFLVVKAEGRGPNRYMPRINNTNNNTNNNNTNNRNAEKPKKPRTRKNKRKSKKSKKSKKN